MHTLSIIIKKLFHQHILFHNQKFSFRCGRLCNDENYFLSKTGFSWHLQKKSRVMQKFYKLKMTYKKRFLSSRHFRYSFLSVKAINYRLTAHNTPKFHLLHNNSSKKFNFVRLAVFLKDNQTIPMPEQDWAVCVSCDEHFQWEIFLLTNTNITKQWERERES